MDIKKIYKHIIPLLVIIAISISCEKTGSHPDDTIPVISTIAGDSIAYESVLRAIPSEYIDAARNSLHIAFQHTSHGTHVSYGLFGLQDFKEGDETSFAITNNNPVAGKLDFRDYAMASFAEAGVDASDLSRNETAFIQATRKAYAMWYILARIAGWDGEE